MPLRSLSDLVNVQRPALPALSAMVSAAGESAELLPVDARVGEGVLFRLQVTVASSLGALAAHTGGLLIDHAWLRVLGGGAAGLPSLAEANGLDEPTSSSTPPRQLEVARDVVGGRFAINGGAFEGELGGWEADSAAVPLDHALACYPPLFSAGSRTGSVHRASVPWAEVVAVNDEMAAQVSALPDGAKFRISPTD